MLTASLLRAQRSGEPFHVAEAELHGVTHADVGAYLLGLWGLPWALVETVAMHHSPDAWRGARTTVPAKVAFAEQLVDAVGDAGAMEEAKASMLDSDMYHVLGDRTARERLLARATAVLLNGSGHD